jgi:hypothetical protein
MKVLLSLALLLFFATQLSAGPILKADSSKHIDILDGQSFLKNPAGTAEAPAVAYQSNSLPRCEWVSTGGVCGGSAFTASSSPVSATPEPAPLILFGTVLLGAFAITKFKS